MVKCWSCESVTSDVGCLSVRFVQIHKYIDRELKTTIQMCRTHDQECFHFIIFKISLDIFMLVFFQSFIAKKWTQWGCLSLNVKLPGVPIHDFHKQSLHPTQRCNSLTLTHTFNFVWYLIPIKLLLWPTPNDMFPNQQGRDTWGSVAGLSYLCLRTEVAERT